MSNLLFSTAPEVSFDTNNETRTEEFQERFDTIFKENDLGIPITKSS